MNYPETSLTLDQPALDLFWKWIYTRQLITYRRHTLNLPPPWTEDPVLANWHFTSAYRELDRGTKFYTNRILPYLSDLGATDGDVLVATFLYRFFNRTGLWEQVFGPSLENGIDWSDHYFVRLEEEIRDYVARGGKAWTGAYIVCAYHRAPGVDKIARVVNFLKHIALYRHDYVNAAHSVASAEEFHKTLQQLPGVGPFNAYEIMSDLLLIEWEPLAGLSENDWANPGPGAINGLKWIWPDVKRKDYQVYMRRLEQGQTSEFLRLRLPFQEISPYPLTMRNIEHSLCEFQKWMKTAHGIGRCRVKFKAGDRAPAPEV